MAALSAAPAKSRKLRSFVVVVAVVLFYTYARTSGKVLEQLWGAESWIADALTVQFSITMQSVAGTISNHFSCSGRNLKGRFYLASRQSYLLYSTASFNLTRLALFGDINSNPGPGPSAKAISKCKSCERTTSICTIHHCYLCL